MADQNDRSTQARENMLSIALVLVGGGIILFFLYLISFGVMGDVLAGGLIFVMIFLLHYYVWGRALLAETSAERAAMLRKEAQTDLSPHRSAPSNAIQDISRTHGIRQ